jgi:hypothetical protein
MATCGRFSGAAGGAVALLARLLATATEAGRAAGRIAGARAPDIRGLEAEIDGLETVRRCWVGVVLDSPVSMPWDCRFA